MANWPFIPARDFRSLPIGGRTPRLVVIHDMEAVESDSTAEDVASYFQHPDKPSSAHICVTPETAVLTSALEWQAAGDLIAGSSLIGVDEFSRDTKGRRLRPCIVLSSGRRLAECVKVLMEDGRTTVCSAEHLWLTQVGSHTGKWEWVAADALRVGDRLCAPLKVWLPGDEQTAWLAGFLDGEGCLHKSSQEMSFSQVIGKGVIEHACSLLDSAGIPYRSFHRKRTNAKHSAILIVNVSGVQGNLELLGRSRPIRFLPRASSLWEGRAISSRSFSSTLRISSINHVGRREVVPLETSTRTYIANGIVSHNCVDNNSIVQCVYDKDVAYAAPGANRDGIQIELAGFGSQTRTQWLDVYSVAVLSLASDAAAQYCIKYRIPAVHLTNAQLKAGKKGIIGHYQASEVYKKSDHTDPGSEFPWDTYIAMVQQFIYDRRAA